MKKGVLLILLLIVTATQASAYEFCDDGIVGEGELRIISVDDMLKDNNQEWKWENMQNIELEIRVENRGDESKDYTIEAVFVEDDNKKNIVEDKDDLEKSFQLSGGERESVSLNFQIKEDVDIGDYNLYIKFYKDGDEDEECIENSEETTTIEKIELCDDGNVDKEDLEITMITDRKGDNEDEWNWIPGDTIELSVDVSNKEYSERNFIVELIMLDGNNEEVEFAKDNSVIENEESLDEGEAETTNFRFELDYNLAEGDYTLYAKMYDEDDESICTALKAEEISKPEQIKIRRAENKVIVTEVTGPTDVQTNTEISYTAKITNTGKAKEDKVLIVAYNRILGLKETLEIEDLESGEEIQVTFIFTLPKNASLGTHQIKFFTEYKYDKKKNIYTEYSEGNDDIRYSVEVNEGEIIETPIEENETNDETENETIEELIENETIFEDIIEETEEANIQSPITGNVVGDSEETSKWPIIFGLLFVAIIGVFLFIKKTKGDRNDYVEQPVVSRRYSAKL